MQPSSRTSPLAERIVSFLAPYIAVLAGAVADWLLVHLHFLADFHDRTRIITDITQLIVWGLTALLVWLSSQRWLPQPKGQDQ